MSFNIESTTLKLRTATDDKLHWKLSNAEQLSQTHHGERAMSHEKGKKSSLLRTEKFAEFIINPA